MKKLVKLKLMLVLLALSLGQVANAQHAAKAAAAKPIATAGKLTEEEKINRLLTYVKSLEGTTFIRNGEEYTAKDAAAHLESKRNKAGDRVKTAREFIESLASASYISGRAYQIKMKDGKTYLSRDVFMQELERIEKEK